MPTTHTRYQVTETPEIANALDAAASQWPGEPRSRLLLHLVREGSAALAARQAASNAADAIAVTSGKYAGVFAKGYLAELRQDWPE